MTFAREDEARFFEAVVDGLSRDPVVVPRDVIRYGNLGIHEKRCNYLLSKWTSKGWYDYGVCLDLGWLTPLGKSVYATLGKMVRQ